MFAGYPAILLPAGDRGWCIAPGAVALPASRDLPARVATVRPEDVGLDLDHPQGRVEAAIRIVAHIMARRPETAALVACEDYVHALRWVTPSGYPAHILWDRRTGKPRGYQGIDHPLRPVPRLPTRATTEEVLAFLLDWIRKSPC